MKIYEDLYQHVYVFDEKPVYIGLTLVNSQAIYILLMHSKLHGLEMGPKLEIGQGYFRTLRWFIVWQVFLQTEHNTPAITKHNANRT